MQQVGRLSVVGAILLLASCVGSLTSGRDRYGEGMRRLRYDPAGAVEDFNEAERELAQGLEDPDLEPSQRVLAVTLRARCLIELERHEDAAALIASDLPGYGPDKPWPGDPVGLALLKAGRLDPERAYAELLLAEKRAATLQGRLHLAWRQVHALRKLGTPQAKTEAVKICEAHKGKLDFDALHKELTTP